MPHYPGAGVGGHCIPVVPLFLQSAARSLGAITELVGAAERINRAMPRMLVDKLEQALAERGKALADASVLFVGVSYKPDVNDARESASVRVIEEALTRGVTVAYYDPWVSQINLDGEPFNSIELGRDVLMTLDAVMLLTAHTNIDYDTIIGSASLVIDTHPGLYPRIGSNILNVWSSAPCPADASSLESMPPLAAAAR
jgi:UDP-N-acetyl-D-glucosamine dehydrogenase